jgi:hypothetical protein
LSDGPDRPTPGPFTLTLRAAFVPDGAQAPAELSAEIYPLRFPATLDATTGELTLANAGINLGGDVVAQFVPDEEQDSEMSWDADGWDAGPKANQHGAGGHGRTGQDEGDQPWQPARDAGVQDSSAPGPAGRNGPGFGRAAATRAAPSSGSAGQTDEADGNSAGGSAWAGSDAQAVRGESVPAQPRTRRMRITT